MPAHSYGFGADEVGRRRMTAYIRRRLKARVGLAIIGEAECSVWKDPIGAKPASRYAGDNSRELYETLGQVARDTGGAIIEQLYHPGGQVWFEEGRRAYAPSRIPQAQSFVLPDSISVSDLAGLRKKFAYAAHVVVSSGMQGIELKADQGKLHHQFLSRAFNVRADQYGGSLVNRMRWLMECLEDIRNALPSSAVIGIRLPGSVTPAEGSPDWLDWSWDITLGECTEITQRLTEGGLIDYVSISGETNSTLWGYSKNHGGEEVPSLTFRDISRSLKAVATVPVLLSGRITTLDQADELIASGDCDAVGMARALVADAELVRKGESPTADPLRECLSCNLVCVRNTWSGGEIACIYDPVSGRESEITYDPKRQMTFAVIGAGPAGMEFSRIAAHLGSRVVLFEKQHELGGMLKSWSRLPGRSSMVKAINYWRTSLANQDNVQMRLGTEVDDLAALRSTFDRVIIANGATECLPDCPGGSDTTFNITSETAIRYTQRLSGKRVLVVDGNRHGDPLGVALLARRHGADVTVVTPFEEIGLGNDISSLGTRIAALVEEKVRVMRFADVRAGRDGCAYVRDHVRNRVTRLKNISYIIWCINPLPSPVTDVEADGFVYRIGNALSPDGLERAVKGAHDLAVSLLSVPE